MINNFTETSEDLQEVLVSKIPHYLNNKSRSYKSEQCFRKNVSYTVVNCSFLCLPDNKFNTMLYRGELEIGRTKKDQDKGQEKTKTRKDSVIVKKLLNKAGSNDLQDNKHLFSTERRMYKDIIPLLLSTCDYGLGKYDQQRYWKSNIAKAGALFQKCYYSSGKCDNAVLVLEDIEARGYRTCVNKSMTLDYNHSILVLQGLARFHALTYAMKKKDSLGFYARVARKIKKGKTFVTKQRVNEQLYAHAYFESLQYAAIQPLEEFAKDVQNARTDLGVQRLNYLLEDTAGLIRALLTPDEPLAVICHGNLNCKNLLFKYDSNKKPVSVKFTDFQNATYASPSVDLSSFLFLNTSPELRAEHWDHLINAYHGTLVSALSDFLECPPEALMTEFSKEVFKHDFSIHALYGYVLTSGYIVSAMLGKEKSEKMLKMFVEGLPSREDIHEYIVENLKLDNEVAKRRLMAIVGELIQRDFLPYALVDENVKDTVL